MLTNVAVGTTLPDGVEIRRTVRSRNKLERAQTAGSNLYWLGNNIPAKESAVVAVKVGQFLLVSLFGAPRQALLC